MSRSPILVVCALVSAVPELARAEQHPSIAEEPPKVQQIQAVERGLFFETDVGFGMFVNKLDDRRYGVSLLTGAFAGYDLLPILSISVGAYAMAASISASDTTPDPIGDLLFLVPMAQIQFALVTTERNFLYVRGGAGLSFGLPKELSGAPYGGNGPAFSGTIGFEHYTKLRHFSLGVQAGALVVTKPGVGIGVSLTPTLKYTF